MKSPCRRDSNDDVNHHIYSILAKIFWIVLVLGLSSTFADTHVLTPIDLGPHFQVLLLLRPDLLTLTNIYTNGNAVRNDIPPNFVHNFVFEKALWKCLSLFHSGPHPVFEHSLHCLPWILPWIHQDWINNNNINRYKPTMTGSQPNTRRIFTVTVTLEAPIAYLICGGPCF